MNELKRVLFNKRIIIVLLLLISLAIGFFAYGEFHSTQDVGLDFLKVNYYYQSELDNIKDSDISSATTEIESKLLRTSVLKSLATYEKMKTENYEEYVEYWISEELDLRTLHPQYAAEYDENKSSLDMGELYAQETALQELSDQLSYISSYPDYLSSIDAKAQQMGSISIFSEANPLSDNNIKNTVEDYSKIKGITLSIGNDKPVVAVVQFEFVHYLTLAFALFVLFTFTEERKKGLSTIVYSTPKGRAHLALKRTGVMFLSVTAVNVVVYGLLFIESFIIYGTEESLFRSIQSIECFKSFTLPISELEFLVLYVLVNIITDLCVTFVVWLVITVISNTSLALGAAGLIFGLEFLLYSLIPHQSNLALLKYINVFYFINPTEAVTQYSNINAFVTVFNRFVSVIASAVVLSLAFAVLCVITYGYKYPSKTPSKLELLIRKVFSKIKALYWCVIEKLNVLGTEIYKLLIMQKGAIVLLVLGAVLFSLTTTETIYYSSADSIVNDFYSKHSGELTEDALIYAKNLEHEINLADMAWEKANENYSQGLITYDEYQVESLKNDAFDSKRQALQTINERIEYIENSEFKAHLVNPRGYEELIGEGGYARQQIYALACVFSIIIILSGVFAFEKHSGMHKSLMTCYKGRDYLYKKKLTSVSMICAVIWIVAVWAELYDVCSQFNLSELNAPLKSLDFYSEFPINPSILIFIVSLYILRYLLLLATAYIVCYFSTKTRYEICLLISALILILPSLLYLVGIEVFSYISLSAIIGFVELAVNYKNIWFVVSLITVLAVGAICVVLSRRTWCRKSR